MNSNKILRQNRLMISHPNIVLALLWMTLNRHTIQFEAE